ncbi:hypothetical protein C8F01DRAFT_1092094 [Mycena amicta]|nr:hypothetical protein C8F01DRAFT_1092094 [Mycena amicta]
MIPYTAPPHADPQESWSRDLEANTVTVVTVPNDPPAPARPPDPAPTHTAPTPHPVLPRPPPQDEPPLWVKPKVLSCPQAASYLTTTRSRKVKSLKHRRDSALVDETPRGPRRYQVQVQRPISPSPAPRGHTTPQSTHQSTPDRDVVMTDAPALLEKGTFLAQPPVDLDNCLHKVADALVLADDAPAPAFQIGGRWEYPVIQLNRLLSGFNADLLRAVDWKFYFPTYRSGSDFVRETAREVWRITKPLLDLVPVDVYTKVTHSSLTTTYGIIFSLGYNLEYAKRILSTLESGGFYVVFASGTPLIYYFECCGLRTADCGHVTVTL